MLIHMTGAHPYCRVRQAARLTGCIDAPDFIPTGSTGDELSGRDEVAAQLEALNIVEWLHSAVAQSFLSDAARVAWEVRTVSDLSDARAYIRSLGVADLADLIERVTWAAQWVEDQRQTPGGAGEHWGSLMCEVDFGLPR